MPNPIPCAMCIDVADSDFLVTNRNDMPWPFDQSTVGLCLRDFLQLGFAMAEAIQGALAEQEVAEGPGVLEQVEAEEGKVPVASGAPKRGRQKTAEPVEESVPEATPEAPEASHD